MKKVFIRGNSERGSEVIKMLKVLGGVNSLCLKGTDDGILYYINTYNNIDHALLESKVGIIIQECFEELHLPEPNKELPNTWEEWVEQNKKVYSEYYMAADSEVYNIKERERNINSDSNLLSKEKDAKAILALIKLKRVRDTYRQGWIPNWKNNSEIKFCIDYNGGMLYRCGHTGANRFLSFQSEKIRNKFYENFKGLIEQAKEFI